MELIEREELLCSLQTHFKSVAKGEGHCVFVSGEAGIGKTALVKAFCRQHQGDCNIYLGACDDLFTPRPLAPLYDILWQVNKDLWPNSHTFEERSQLFSKFFHELRKHEQAILIVFEDIHWADEATLDFIRFFVKRIAQLRCLFILTYRDDVIHAHNSLRNILGQLSPDCFTRLSINPLSKEAVAEMAVKKGYSGEDVYSISGGNPFYVNEILSGYSLNVPDNIKDAILSVYNRLQETTRRIWDLLSIIPTSFEIKYLEKFEPLYASSLESSLEGKILFVDEEKIFFKHELFRRTIETFLSPLKKIYLNKIVLDILRESFEKNGEIERIVHHAKNANEVGLVAQYAPVAARQAACMGSHIEASKLYLTAIEYYQGNEKSTLIEFYEAYAYECYLINQIKEAIKYAGKSLKIWREKNDAERIGNSLRFHSRLWWFVGNRKKAEAFAEQAIAVLNALPPSKTQAMAYSNMSQLKMLCGQAEECIWWGEKAITIAQELGDEETLCHALNNVGTIQMKIKSSISNGEEILAQSLEIALKNSFHEHVSRAYTNLASNWLEMKEYELSKKVLEEGISYCEERDLDSWETYMLALETRMHFETGNWTEAWCIADKLLKNESQSPLFKIIILIVKATVMIRRGEMHALPLLLDAKTRAFETMELQRIIPSLCALLEYEWLTGTTVIKKEELDYAINEFEQPGNIFESSEFVFWMLKARKKQLQSREDYKLYEINTPEDAFKVAELWEKTGCPYEQALALYEGSDNDKRKAITIVHALGATAVYEKLRQEMRSLGIKNIPGGSRKESRTNSALLTSRELEILPLLKEGLLNKEIAAKLFISVKTVDHHISSILFKLDVNSRSKAVAQAVRQKIIK